jgi:diguanylate cyclase (GGDEF)-like protein
MSDARRAAYLAAYDLLEAVQSEDHAGAVARLPQAAEQADISRWPEVEFVLAAAEIVYLVTRPDGSPELPAALDALVQRAEALDLPAFLAMALGLRALAASTAADTTSLLADASRAVVLLDDDRQPALDRCTAYVVTAASLNTLRLWELVDELYSHAAELGPLSGAPAQAAAVATNRVLTRLEWALALLENGDDAGAAQQLSRVSDVVPLALADELPLLWRQNVETAAEVVRLLRGEDPDIRATSRTELRAALIAGSDQEMLPLLEAASAWALWHHGRLDEAVAAALPLASLPSPSSGARTFPLWVRATVLATHEPSDATRAQREHAAFVTRLLWESREVVLSAARAKIDVERRRAEHARLSRAVRTDSLTGLQNRRSFDDWLQGASSASRRRTALLLVDLDGFKQINDTFGHECGDQVLRRIGELMRATIRTDDVAIRHGGDEFAVLLSHEHLTPVAAWQRAEELRAAVTAIPWGDLRPGLVVTVTVGVGISVDTLAGDGALIEPVEIYRSADRALYAAKRDGSGLVMEEAGVTSP